MAVSVGVGGKVASIRSKGHCRDGSFVSMDGLKNISDMIKGSHFTELLEVCMQMCPMMSK